MRALALAALLLGCSAKPKPAPGVAYMLRPEVSWPMHTIHAGLSGADGVDLADVNGDGLLDATTPWEQSGIVTVSIHPAGAAVEDRWPTVRVNASLLYGVEDAVFGDIDGDGRVDVVSASEGKRLSIHFAPQVADILTPAAWTTVTITAATNLQRWSKVDVADMNGDGRLDIVAGGRVSPATVGIFHGPASPRTAGAWTYGAVGAVAWTMGLEARDVDGDGDKDIILSDRDYITSPTPNNYALQGTRWLEAPSWTNHPIGPVLGNHKFFTVADYDGDGALDVIDGRSSSTLNQTFLKRSPDWLTWTTTIIPQPENVGHYHHAAVGDLNIDGATDLAFSYSSAFGTLSGVAWVGVAGARGEVSGAPGAKFDTLEAVDIDGDGDLDLVTSEQETEQLGLVWYSNPRIDSVPAPPPADAGPPDAAPCCPCGA